MILTDANLQVSERHQEFLALINMIGYAFGIAESLGASIAASHMDAAREALITELMGEFAGVLSTDGIARLAAARAGHC